MASGSVRRIETESEVSAYLAKMKHALENGAQIQFQIDRQVDNERDAYFTNRFTLSELFPDEAPSEVFRRELMTLTKANYMGTVRDIRFPKRSEMREFGKIYRQSDEVYIKGSLYKSKNRTIKLGRRRQSYSICNVFSFCRNAFFTVYIPL